jgi:hypothetical protein
MKLEFSRQIFEKCSNIKFHENPPSGSRLVACGQTDRLTKLCEKRLKSHSEKRHDLRTSLIVIRVFGRGKWRVSSRSQYNHIKENEMGGIYV